MLDALGQRYVVETGSSDDGNVRYTRFSDGYLVIEGNLTGNAVGNTGTITFPVPYSTTQYSVVGNQHTDNEFNDVNGFKVVIGSKTTSGFNYMLNYVNSSGPHIGATNGKFSFLACGY